MSDYGATDYDDYNHTFNCDSCSFYADYEGSFDSAWKQARDDGWRAFKVKNEWTRKCPSCASSEAGPKLKPLGKK